MHLIGSLVEQWAFMTTRYADSTFSIYTAAAGAVAVGLVGLWLIKYRKAHAAESET